MKNYFLILSLFLSIGSWAEIKSGEVSALEDQIPLLERVPKDLLNEIDEFAGKGVILLEDTGPISLTSHRDPVVISAESLSDHHLGDSPHTKNILASRTSNGILCTLYLSKLCLFDTSSKKPTLVETIDFEAGESGVSIPKFEQAKDGVQFTIKTYILSPADQKKRLKTYLATNLNNKNPLAHTGETFVKRREATAMTKKIVLFASWGVGLIYTIAKAFQSY